MQGIGIYYAPYNSTINQIVCDTSIGVQTIELCSYAGTKFVKIYGKIYYINYDINKDLICLYRDLDHNSSGDINIKCDNWLHAMRYMDNYTVEIKHDWHKTCYM